MICNLELLQFYIYSLYVTLKLKFMIIAEKVKNRANKYGSHKLAFIEGAKFALKNQFINTNIDLPCNHKELIVDNGLVTHTKIVVAVAENNCFLLTGMHLSQGKWYWDTDKNVSMWMEIPKL